MCRQRYGAEAEKLTAHPLIGEPDQAFPASSANTAFGNATEDTVALLPSNISADDGDSRDLPSVFTFGGSELPFAGAFASAPLDAAVSQSEQAADHFAKSEQSAGPVFNGVSTAWEEDCSYWATINNQGIDL